LTKIEHGETKRIQGKSSPHLGYIEGKEFLALRLKCSALFRPTDTSINTSQKKGASREENANKPT